MNKCETSLRSSVPCLGHTRNKKNAFVLCDLDKVKIDTSFKDVHPATFFLAYLSL